jgi:lipoprotein signal peptidase
LFIWTAVLALLLDQASKLLAHSLLPPYVPQPVLGQVLRFVLVLRRALCRLHIPTDFREGLA